MRAEEECQDMQMTQFYIREKTLTVYLDFMSVVRDKCNTHIVLRLKVWIIRGVA